MDRKSVIILVLLGIIVGCAAGVVTHEAIEPEASAQAPWTGQRWEHICTSINPTKVENLTAFGQEGWEMVSVAPVKVGTIPEEMQWGSWVSKHVVCFKRPIAQAVPSIKKID